MTAYWIVFAIMFLLQFVKVYTKKEYLWRLIISFIPLFIFAAFRVNFGYDYEAYQEIFDIVHAHPGQYEDIREEIGYLKLNEWLPTFRSLIIVTSLFTCCAYIFLFYKVIPANYAWLAVLLMFFAGDKAIFFMFSGIRNAISISILIFTLPLLEKRKLLPFVVCMLIAALFHKTAYIYFPMAYLVCSNKDITRREIFVWVGVFCFFFVFSHMSIMRQVEMVVNSIFDDGRYESYIDLINEVGDNNGILGRIAMIMTFIPALIFARSNSFSPQCNVIMRLGLMYIMSMAMAGLSMRAPQHFIMFFVAMAVYIFANSRNTLFKYGYTIFVVAYLAYAFFVVYCGSPTFPYDVYESTLFGIID